jgi:hypothetical protein
MRCMAAAPGREAEDVAVNAEQAAVYGDGSRFTAAARPTAIRVIV